MVIEKPIRASWGNFPDVLIFAEEGAVKRYPEYLAAKTGEVSAAKRLAADLRPLRRLYRSLPGVMQYFCRYMRWRQAG